MSIPISGSSREVHDYTEGASYQEVQNAISNARRSRRDSEYSGFGDEEGMFSGPGHGANPSSVTRMSHIEPARRSSEWSRRSRSRRGSQDTTGGFHPSSFDDEEAEPFFNRPRQSSPSPPPRGMLENLASFFGGTGKENASGSRRRVSRRRSSTSRYSARSARSVFTESDDGGGGRETSQERWGYSSGEEDDDEDEELSVIDNISLSGSMAFGSEPPSPVAASQTLPLLSHDPIFGGETRIDIETPFALLEPPPPGPPSRQTLYITDEDTTIRFVGYQTIQWRQWVWTTGCWISLGILGLLGHWFPQLWIRWVARETAFKNARDGFVVVESAFRDITLFPLQQLDYPYPLKTAFPLSPAEENRLSDVFIEPEAIINMLTVVDYRYSRFALDPRTGLFSIIQDWRDPSWAELASVQQGIPSDVRLQRSIFFGENVIEIQGKRTMTLLVDEVIHPFYVFQIASIILWSLDDYYYYAFCIALISFISIGTTLVDTKRNIARMREMSKYSCNVTTLLNNEWVEQDSTHLIPGDIVDLSRSPPPLLPADLFLISGDAIVNESMLTGESVPVSKMPAKAEDFIRWNEKREENAKCFLYSGTRVVRVRATVGPDGSASQPAIALVARTGFNTTKGALVRSMLFPKPIGFKFYQDSIRFIGVLAGIAGLGFLVSAFKFVELGLKWQTIMIRALDLITVVVPPALPATLSIGTSFAIGRLRKLGIFCISPSRVNVAGKINVCCFDKTGTLTEDGLDILGVRAPERTGKRFGELLDDVVDLPHGSEKAQFLHALATCHSLKLIDGEVLGDPLDVKMFEFTKWTLDEGQNAGIGAIKNKARTVVEHTALVQNVVRPPGSAQFRLEDALKGGSRHAHFLELGVIRTFEFVSALRRMSVVVKRLKSSSMEVYVKGAPEVMSSICEPDSFPDDFDDLLSYYTKQGYRVIAIAGKSVDGLTWLKAQRMKREHAESSLRFLGLMIFENKLKLGTTPAIQALRSAHLACRMITGDNPLTAVSVARECSLVSQTAHAFSPRFLIGGPSTPASKLEWACMDDPSWHLDSYSLKPMAAPSRHGIDMEQMSFHDYTLVITGDVFRWMISYAPLETLQRMLVKTHVFARMSPDEKNEVVERLQSLGYTVMMCGDGANDCAALKAADVGISLSEAEASVAAPFTTDTPDIGCVLDVIKEGRAALVTSFSCFKYMALYSMIQFVTVTLLYSFASSLGDFQFLYIDLFIIIPVAVAMARTLPFPRIHSKRPTASLVSKKVLVSIIGQIVLAAIFQGWAYLWVRQQSWYTPPPKSDPDVDGNKLESLNWENSSLFLISCFQYILVAAVFSIGPPYRKPMWTNGWLMASLCALTLVNVLVLLSPPKGLRDLLTLKDIPLEGRYVLLGTVVLNACIAVSFERFGTQAVMWIFERWKKRKWKDVRAAYKALDVE
ncbi:P-type ATPase [Flagelloscypha sp. PMI_526]|nr:P-type ATPase [Flagelloscypha sp. PMI_526]